MANVEEALRMAAAFASVGVTHYALSVIDDFQNKKVPGRQLTNAHTNEIRFRIRNILTEADREHWSVILRPEQPAGMMILQLDDLDVSKVEMLKRHTLLAIRTSAANYQVWIALTGAPETKGGQRAFALRLNRGVGADYHASRAGRIAGSVNYKPRHGPAFPTVEIVYLNNSHTVSCGDLESAGLVAAPPPKPVPPSQHHSAPRGLWPDYPLVLARAPMRKDGSGRDRSTADAFFCKLAAVRGHSPEAIAAELVRVSEKAQTEIARGNINYAKQKAEWGVQVAGQ
jgi:hypothetical protein